MLGKHPGLRLILWLMPDQDEQPLIEDAAKVGLTLQPLRQSCRQHSLEPAWVPGFAALSRIQAKHAAGQPAP